MHTMGPTAPSVARITPSDLLDRGRLQHDIVGRLSENVGHNPLERASRADVTKVSVAERLPPPEAHGRYTSTVDVVPSIRVGNRSNQPRWPSSTANGMRQPRLATSGSCQETASSPGSGGWSHSVTSNTGARANWPPTVRPSSKSGGSVSMSIPELSEQGGVRGGNGRAGVDDSAQLGGPRCPHQRYDGPHDRRAVGIRRLLQIDVAVAPGRHRMEASQARPTNIGASASGTRWTTTSGRGPSRSTIVRSASSSSASATTSPASLTATHRPRYRSTSS